jgi:hypothetical protein
MFPRGLVALFVVGYAGSARADIHLSMGVKWNPVNYTKPVSATMGGPNGPTATPLAGWQTTSLDNNFGLFFLDGRLGVQLGLDVGYGSATKEATGLNVDMSYTQFGFSIGGKFYILAPKASRVSPYVALDFFKYFASVTTNDMTVPNDQAGYIAGLSSPLGVNAAFGAEYFFTPAFSLGAEVLGLRFAYSEGDYTIAGGFGGDNKLTAKNMYVTFYTGISLNYRFAIAGSVRVKEEAPPPGDDDTPTRPVRKVTPEKKPESPTRPAPSVNKDEEPPPENPEEVD